MNVDIIHTNRKLIRKSTIPRIVLAALTFGFKKSTLFILQKHSNHNIIKFPLRARGVGYGGGVAASDAFSPIANELSEFNCFECRYKKRISFTG